MSELIQKIEKAWSRKTVPYSSIMYALMLEDCLTGFFLLLDQPAIGVDKDKKACVCVNLEDWISIKRVADETATPFRIVAQGKTMIAKGFLPHIGLTHPVRNVDGELMVFVPIEEMKRV